LKLLDDNFSKEGYKVNNKEVSVEEIEKAAQNKVLGAVLTLAGQVAGANFND